MNRREQPSDERRTDGGPAAGEVPNEDEVAREFPAASDQPLREQRDLVDDDGTDVRQYTGEPVETEDGTVTPQQMAVGADGVVGGGEFPRRSRTESTDESAGSTDERDGRPSTSGGDDR